MKIVLASYRQDQTHSYKLSYLPLRSDNNQTHLSVYGEKRFVNFDLLSAFQFKSADAKSKNQHHDVLRKPSSDSSNVFLPYFPVLKLFREISSSRTGECHNHQARCQPVQSIHSYLHLVSHHHCQSRRLTIALDTVIQLHKFEYRMTKVPSSGMDRLSSSSGDRVNSRDKAIHDTARFRNDNELLLLIHMKYRNRLIRYRRFMPMYRIAATHQLHGDCLTHSIRSPFRKTSSGKATAPLTRVTPLCRACF